MLTLNELENIAKWQPYRSDWPVDRNLTDDNILKHYGQFIREMNNDSTFDCTQTQDGQMTNYLEFICYPKASSKQAQECIMVCVSLCAPVAAYGQTSFEKNDKSFSFSFLEPESLGVISSPELKPIEEKILALLRRQKCEILDTQFASKKLPEAITEKLDSLNFGNQVLHALFQWND